ncbi:MAG: LemA family protein [Phycisphaerales bacterium]|nr:LemA family protein [Phycisphaerales bacterium]
MIILGNALAVVVGLLIAIVVLVASVGMWVVGIYNRLQRLRVATESALSGIDVQLKRRHDLVPNLVSTVQGYAAHEKGTLDAVIKARASAMSAGSIGEKAAAEGALTGALGRLMAIAEAYPDLKANQNFLQLQGELANLENAISSTRTGFNSSAGGFNATLAQFPTNIIGGIFTFKPFEFFKADEASREVPVVKF